VLGDTEATISAIGKDFLMKNFKNTNNSINFKEIKQINVGGFLSDSGKSYVCNSTVNIVILTKVANRIKINKLTMHVIDNLRENVIVGFQDLTKIIGLVNIPVTFPDLNVINEVIKKSPISVQHEDPRKLKLINLSHGSQFSFNEFH
jgi:hypothetical protein